MSEPLVSIVLLTRNGGDRLRQALEAVDRQHTDFAREIVVVDSSSSDGTLALLQQRAATLISIPPRDFDHGLTRNLGVERSRGAFVVLLVQDAVPVGNEWLAALVDPLRRDARLAGSFARQVPRADASALTRFYLSRWRAAQPESRTTFLDSRESFDALSPFERFERAVFDNVCSCLRRAVWEQIPFRATPIAEDLEWAREVLLAGHGLAYVAEAMVEHSHDRSALYELKRTWVLHQQLHRLFGVRTIPTAGALARSVGSSLVLHRRELQAVGASPRAHLHAAALGVAWPVGQFLGGWTAASGRPHWRPRGV